MFARNRLIAELKTAVMEYVAESTGAKVVREYDWNFIEKANIRNHRKTDIAELHIIMQVAEGKAESLYELIDNVKKLLAKMYVGWRSRSDLRDKLNTVLVDQLAEAQLLADSLELLNELNEKHAQVSALEIEVKTQADLNDQLVGRLDKAQLQYMEVMEKFLNVKKENERLQILVEGQKQTIDSLATELSTRIYSGGNQLTYFGGKHQESKFVPSVVVNTQKIGLKG